MAVIEQESASGLRHSLTALSAVAAAAGDSSTEGSMDGRDEGTIERKEEEELSPHSSGEREREGEDRESECTRRRLRGRSE